MQDLVNFQVDTVAKGLGYAAGPAWAPEGYLVFSDTPGSKIMKISPRGTEVLRDNSGGPSGNAFDQRGRLYTCETHTRRVTRMEPGGKVQVLAERFEGKRFNAPNDLVVTDNGHVYFTDPAFGNQQDTRELSHFGLYNITPDREVRLMAKYEGRPNGICLSHDRKTLYVTNSDERNLRAYTIARDGTLSGEHIAISKIEGVPNAVCTDDKGRLYVAAGSLKLYSRERNPLKEIPLHLTPSGMVFGDAGLSTLYVTARSLVYRVQLEWKGAASN